MAKIDPAFQAAPNLGGTSYNPVEFARRHNLEKFQIQKQQQEEQARNTAKGLENLMVDVKGWEDQQGFKEIMSDQDRILNGFLDLSKRGMNLVSPKTTQEIMAYKTIADEHQKLAQKVDTWNQQKAIYDLYTKAIQQDSILPEADQKIDREATMVNLQKVLKTKDILSRGNDLQNLVVKKTEYGDVIKKVAENKDFFEKPTTRQVIDKDTNEIKTVEDFTPEQDKSNQKKLGVMYEGFDQSYKNTIRKQRENDPNPKLNVMSDKDYFVSEFNPTYRKKFLEKPIGKGGAGMSINFGGKDTKVVPGEFTNEEYPFGQGADARVYRDRFMVSTKTPVEVPLGASGSTYLMGGKWQPVTGGGNVEATLSFYSPERDEFVFRTTTAQMEPFLMNNMPVAVPRKNLGPEADKFPIIVDGKQTTIGEYRKKEGFGKDPAVRTIGGKDFRDTTPYIPKKK